MALLEHWLLLTMAITSATVMLPGVTMSGGLGVALGIAVVFALLNVMLGTLARLIAAPLVVITLGLGTLVTNSCCLLLTDRLVSSLEIDGLGTAVLGGVLISVVALVVTFLLDLTHDRTHVGAA
jgi:putative membrane protein